VVIVTIRMPRTTELPSRRGKDESLASPQKILGRLISATLPHAAAWPMRGFIRGTFRLGPKTAFPDTCRALNKTRSNLRNILNFDQRSIFSRVFEYRLAVGRACGWWGFSRPALARMPSIACFRTRGSCRPQAHSIYAFSATMHYEPMAALRQAARVFLLQGWLCKWRTAPAMCSKLYLLLGLNPSRGRRTGFANRPGSTVGFLQRCKVIFPSPYYATNFRFPCRAFATRQGGES